MNRNPSGWATANYVKTHNGWAWPNQQVTHSTPNRPLGTTRNINSPAEELLATAVAWWDTSKYSPNDRFLRNLGYGGSGLDARLGSSIVPNSNDPTYLPWNGVNYVFIPDSNSSLTCVAPATATSYIAYSLDLTTTTGNITGGASFTFSTAGSWTQIDLLDASSVVVASMNSNTGTFVYASTTTLAVAATAIDTTITVASAANIKIGSIIQINSEQMLVTEIAGSVVTVTRGVNGTFILAQAINSIVWMSAVYTDSFAVEWSLNLPCTIANNTGGRKKAVFVVRPTFVLGTDDYFEVTGNQQQSAFSFDPNQSFTVFISYISQEPLGQASGNGRTISKGWFLSSSFGNSLFNFTGTNGIGASTQINTSPQPARNEPVTHFVRRAKNIGPATPNNTNPLTFPSQQVSSGFLSRRDAKAAAAVQRAFVLVEPQSVGQIFSTANLNIGFGVYASSMEFLGAAVFRKPLTNTEMDTISRYYGSL
jgi:hypothetical protein